ncbi:MAG: DUF58 domain-containing protein [Anaerolineales bacterium]
MLSFLPFLLLLFLVAIALRIDFFFTIAYLFFGMWLAARWWARRNVRHIKVKREYVNRAFFGDEVPVRVEVRNSGVLPVTWLQVKESVPVDLGLPRRPARVFSLNARGTDELTYTLNCRKRGVYALGPLSVQTGDLFGVTQALSAETPREPMIVYPRVVPLSRLGLPTRSPLAVLRSVTPLFEDTARVIGVRDYSPGDSLRRIHWTATASVGRLLVKNYQPAIARETMLFLNLNAESYDMRGRHDAVELAITVAASIANHIIVRERQPVGLATEAHDALHDTHTRFVLPARGERAHLMAVLETLARVHMASAFSFTEFLRAQRPHLPWGTTLIIITGRDTPELLDTLALLRQAGFPLALILVQYVRATQAMQQRAAILRMPLYHVWHEDDAEKGLAPNYAN